MKTSSLIFVFISFFIFSCSNSKKAVEQSETDTTVESEHPKAIIDQLPKNYLKTTINNVRVEDNHLHINVSYSGGCEEQTFQLIGSAAVMKSYPAKRPVVLARDDKGDTCRQWITKDLVFEIKALADQQKDGSTIVLILDNYKGEIEYTFSE